MNHCFGPFYCKLNATENLIKSDLKKSPPQYFIRMTFLTPILVPDDAHINLGNPALLLHF